MGVIKHGMCDTHLYRLWANMKRRINSPSKGDECYEGLLYDHSFEKFNNFMEWALANGYEEGLSIDRIDNSKGYYPENCRFIKLAHQQRNKRNSKLITWKGETHCVREWEELLGFKYDVIKSRLLRGWSVDDALGKTSEEGKQQRIEKAKQYERNERGMFK